MKFGDTPLDQASGAILAHSVRTVDVSFKKGRVLTESDVDCLRTAGIESVIAARLGTDDVGEDAAAARIARGEERWQAQLGRAQIGRASCRERV